MGAHGLLASAWGMGSGEGHMEGGSSLAGQFQIRDEMLSQNKVESNKKEIQLALTPGLQIDTSSSAPEYKTSACTLPPLYSFCQKFYHNNPNTNPLTGSTSILS